jgi:pimeloyl-ACP methyl ester carboxylesterase
MSTIGITRRQAVAALAATPVAAIVDVTETATAPTTFVLVHGAWHGGWCWTRVSPLLRAAGHTVFTPTLTGLGERSHLLTRDVGLDTHITDIVQVLEFEDLENVVLVGHSYGGMVITGVADKASDRISQLVYLDAMLPENGKAITDYNPRQLAPITEDSWHDPAGEPQEYGVTDERDVAWVKKRLTDMPRKCITQPLTLADDKSRRIKGAYILCSTRPFASEAAQRAKQRGYRYRELESAGHDAMMTQPRELTKILIDLA